MGIDQKVYAFDGNGAILWQSETLPGYIQYPPAVTDMDGDGNVEIAVNTNYVSIYNGSTVLLDHEGAIMPGWPVSYNNNSMSCSPVMADVTGDGQLEVVAVERRLPTPIQTALHVLNMSGEPATADWPVVFDGIPAVTPAVGDIDSDGSPDIVFATSNSFLYAVDNTGALHENYPVSHENSGISYQSPILADLTGDGDVEIVGAWHGDAPGFYVYDNEGEFEDGWPYEVDNWTYTPPTVADIDADGNYELFFSVPAYQEGVELDVMYGFDAQGDLLPGFPISKEGGCEGVISVADIDANGVQDLIFTSNITDPAGYGYIHAYATDGSGQLEGFPLRPKGFTFLNSAVLGDVDGDGMLDLTALSYTLFSGSDSIFVNAYNLNVPYEPADILSNGYHGGNTHAGVVGSIPTGIKANFTPGSFLLYPNPSTGLLKIEIPTDLAAHTLKVMDASGRLVLNRQIEMPEKVVEIPTENLSPGTYFVLLESNEATRVAKWVVQ